MPELNHLTASLTENWPVWLVNRGVDRRRGDRRLQTESAQLDHLSVSRRRLDLQHHVASVGKGSAGVSREPSSA